MRFNFCPTCGSEDITKQDGHCFYCGNQKTYIDKFIKMKDTPFTRAYIASQEDDGDKGHTNLIELWQLGVDYGREECAKMLEINTQELLLMAGEMTAQELRTVKAVLSAMARKIKDK